MEERLTSLRELEYRRAAIVKSIEEQGKLTLEIAAAIQDADTKACLEDLYLPYKPKRRTKAQIAREAGLEPLALELLHDPMQDPLAELVRIEPRAIGVGQYQHDVSQGQLARTLDTVVEDCVNAVGADVNTASVPQTNVRSAKASAERPAS